MATPCTMEAHIQREISEEIRRSSNFKSRGAIKLRVLLKIARLMGVSRDSIHETKDAIYIDPSVSSSLENLYVGSCLYCRPECDKNTEGNPFSREERLTIEQLFSKDFAKPQDITKVVSLLRKKLCFRSQDAAETENADEEEEENDSSVKYHRTRRTLWEIFAVDGLADEGEGWDDLRPYYENLAHPLTYGERNDSSERDLSLPEKVIETHVRAVRTLYERVDYATPLRLRTLFLRWLLPDEGNGSEKEEEEEEEGALRPEDRDEYLAECYRRCVGPGLDRVALWLKRRTEARRRTGTPAAAAARREREDDRRKKRKRCASEAGDEVFRAETPLVPAPTTTSRTHDSPDKHAKDKNFADALQTGDSPPAKKTKKSSPRSENKHGGKKNTEKGTKTCSKNEKRKREKDHPSKKKTVTHGPSASEETTKKDTTDKIVLTTDFSTSSFSNTREETVPNAFDSADSYRYIRKLSAGETENTSGNDTFTFVLKKTS